MEFKMRNKFIKPFRMVFCLASVVGLSCILAFAVSADGGTAVNLANVNKNESGEGYYWNNPDEILTLDGFSVSTDEDFGLKLPADATVELKGTNRISASKYAVGCPGSVTFKGDGELILESGESALYSYSTNSNHKIKITEGKYKFTSGEEVIKLDGAEFSVTGGSLELTSSGELAIFGRDLSFTGGSVTAAGALRASHLIKINRSSLEIGAQTQALICENLIDISNVELSLGDSPSSLSVADEYGNEKYMIAIPEKEEGRRSIIFGENVSGVLDYAALAAVVILIAAAIVVPILLRKRKTAKLYEKLENENADKK